MAVLEWAPNAPAGPLDVNGNLTTALYSYREAVFQVLP